jgi:hypothetical protein
MQLSLLLFAQIDDRHPVPGLLRVSLHQEIRPHLTWHQLGLILQERVLQSLLRLAHRNRPLLVVTHHWPLRLICAERGLPRVLHAQVRGFSHRCV